MDDPYAPEAFRALLVAAESPLHRAARLGDHDGIRALVAAGADLEKEVELWYQPGESVRLTPVLIAAGSSDGATVDTVRLLLDLGAAPVPPEDRELLSAARCAAGGLDYLFPGSGDAARLRLALERGCDPDETCCDISLLAAAAETGDLERARVVLDAGADPDPPGYLRPPIEFQIPLFTAAKSGNAAVVRALLDAGATPDLIDDAKQTAIFHATTREVMEVLIVAGLDVDARDQFDWTPLVMAVSRCDVDLAAALLAVGADPTASHDRGFTAFMWAAMAWRNGRELMRLLIAAGADPHAVSDLGWNAFHAAVDRVRHEDTILSNLETLAMLGVDINHRDRRGGTPLARAHSDAVASILVELGASR
jgi:hypothetical protein